MNLVNSLLALGVYTYMLAYVMVGIGIELEEE